MKKIITSVGEDVEKPEYSYIASQNVNGFGNSLAVPQKANHRGVKCGG